MKGGIANSLSSTVLKEEFCAFLTNVLKDLLVGLVFFQIKNSEC